jgi:transcriptional regulator with XRE-family HTH domain
VILLVERLKELRNVLNLSQKELGERIGVSRDVISNIELDRVEFKEHLIKLICKEFNISYIWLKTGNGEMFENNMNDTTILFDRIMAGENETAKRVFSAFARFSDDDWLMIEKIIDKISEKEDIKKAD